jgi:hypothetical protein
MDKERGKEKGKIFQRNKYTTTTSMGGRAPTHARPIKRTGKI